ncbi:hypothetical protein GCM10009584_04440 [Ornithinimicrobium humiphilum]|uniref:PH (Pleckstrin Homology) domain-containing protein n=1 Tax=Ornithinimicrobium humiphilum TaxID=125288 RepID=A0A543K7W3_9MICO|nr:PH domain-containing protein [Ornithinimicrobium humiphilum]TQM91172.1 PH (Pleckstrin Homology) domain-containing protein [Ornithinimicrobium humiphilum]
MTSPAQVRISRRILDRYLLDEETPVVATRSHWAKLTEPFLTAFVALLAVGALTATLDARTEMLGTVLWCLWFVVAGRAVWRLLEWHNEWFVATDRRLLLVYGLLTHKVAMMPLRKVTDMNYGRSILGRMLGYGQFIMESAGQDQAMRVISWVPNPDEKYRRICATIFGPEGADEDDAGPRRVHEAFDQEVEPDPWEISYDDQEPSVVDRFDPDVVHVQVRRRQAAPRRSRWEDEVGPEDLPSDWEWVGREAQRARGATRRRSVAVDPDPTPPWR